VRRRQRSQFRSTRAGAHDPACSVCWACSGTHGVLLDAEPPISGDRRGAQTCVHMMPRNADRNTNRLMQHAYMQPCLHKCRPVGREAQAVSKTGYCVLQIYSA
jgi:hypothetical protein